VQKLRSSIQTSLGRRCGGDRAEQAAFLDVAVLALENVEDEVYFLVENHQGLPRQRRARHALVRRRALFAGREAVAMTEYRGSFWPGFPFKLSSMPDKSVAVSRSSARETQNSTPLSFY